MATPLSKVALFATLSLGCASSPPEAPRTKPEPRLHEGPLTDYVTSAGLEWMIVADVPELLANAELALSIGLLLPDERIELYTEASGLDLRRVRTLLIAKYTLSTLYLAETEEGLAVERRFAERFDEPPVVRARHPRLRSLYGVRGGYPNMLLSVRDRFVGLCVGDPTPARVAELYAVGELGKVAPVLKGAALGSVPDAFHSAPLRFYAAGPFEGEWARAARGLLGGATALAASARPHGASLDVEVVLLGAWDALEDVPRAEAAWRDLADSSVGSLLGLVEPASAPRVESDASALRLALGVRTHPLAQGLRAAVAAELEEFFKSVPAAEPRGLARPHDGSR